MQTNTQQNHDKEELARCSVPLYARVVEGEVETREVKVVEGAVEEIRVVKVVDSALDKVDTVVEGGAVETGEVSSSKIPSSLMLGKQWTSRVPSTLSISL